MKPKRDAHAATIIVEEPKYATHTDDSAHEDQDVEMEEVAAELAHILKAEPVDTKRLAQCLRMIHEVCSAPLHTEDHETIEDYK